MSLMSLPEGRILAIVTVSQNRLNTIDRSLEVILRGLISETKL